MENFNFKIVKARTKRIQSTPIVGLSTSSNHFNLNSVAAEALGLEAGDNVMIIFNPGTDEDRRFFICKAEEGEDSTAKLGQTGSNFHFNYSGIYGSIMLNEEKRAMISIDELITAGIMSNVVTKSGNKTVRGNLKLAYTLESIGEMVIEEDGDPREIFAFTNRVETLVGDTDEDEDAENVGGLGDEA